MLLSVTKSVTVSALFVTISSYLMARRCSTHLLLKGLKLGLLLCLVGFDFLCSITASVFETLCSVCRQQGGMLNVSREQVLESRMYGLLPTHTLWPLLRSWLPLSRRRGGSECQHCVMDECVSSVLDVCYLIVAWNESTCVLAAWVRDTITEWYQLGAYTERGSGKAGVPL